MSADRKAAGPCKAVSSTASQKQRGSPLLTQSWDTGPSTLRCSMWQPASASLVSMSDSNLVTLNSKSNVLGKMHMEAWRRMCKRQREWSGGDTRLTTHLMCPLFLPLCLWLDLNKHCWSLFKHSYADNMAFYLKQSKSGGWLGSRGEFRL